MRILGFDIIRAKPGEGIILSQDALAKIAVDQGGNIRIPQASTAGGAGFGDVITDSDREWAVTREPVAYRVTYMVADDVFDKWFSVDDPKTEGGDPDLDRKVQKVLRKLEAQSVLANALALERTYGWSLIIGAFSDAHSTQDLAEELREGSELTDLAVYPKIKVTSIERDKDLESERFGEPVIYNVDRGSGRRLRIHYTRVIHVQTRPTGLSVLDPIWDDLTCLRNIRWGMSQTIYRIGSGFPVITLTGKTLEQIQAYAEAGYFTNLMSRTFLLKNESIDIEFKGAQGAALNPEPYYTPLLENISAGTGIPVAILRGAQAGALIGSEVNEREYFKVISSQHGKVEPPVRQLIDWVMPQSEADIKDYEVNWLGGVELSEKDKAATELMHQQARQIETSYKTLDEVRQTEGLQDLPEQQGAIVLGISKAQPQAAAPFGGEINMDQDKETHPTLVAGLQAIAQQAHDKKLSRANALTQGRALIKLYHDHEVERAKAYLATKMGRPIVNLPPEVDRQYEEMLRQYYANFEAILDDALKATE
jgi:hypothetical protein